MKTEQPLWGRGIMVSPQHFQQQAAYAAWSAECIARLGLNHPWGVIESTFESDMLKLGRLRHVPAAIPLRLENQYFSLDVSHPLAVDMLESGCCMFYVPGMLGEPELELFAVLRT